jgi:hypothetical protein
MQVHCKGYGSERALAYIEGQQERRIHPPRRGMLVAIVRCVYQSEAVVAVR